MKGYAAWMIWNSGSATRAMPSRTLMALMISAAGSIHSVSLFVASFYSRQRVAWGCCQMTWRLWLRAPHM